MKISSILVGYDGFDAGDPLPALARALAEEHGAKIRVVNVVPPLSLSQKLLKAGASDLQDQLVAERRAALEALVAKTRERGIDTEVVVRVGKPAEELVREAMTGGDDILLIMDEPQRRGAERGFGATTTRLFRCCPCPVLADRGPRTYKHSRIMAAVDLDVDASDPILPNHQVMELALALCRAADARLDVFHAWLLWGEHLLRSHASGEDVDEQVAEHHGAVKNALEQLIASHDTSGVDVHELLVKGDPRRLLPQVIEQEQIELLVMGTISRTGLPGLLIGNTAERILADLKCSVLAVKPEGFQSPVEP